MIEQFFLNINKSFVSVVNFKTAESDTCVIFVHAYSNWKDEHDYMFTRIANSLYKNGISSILFDMRGHGESDLLLEEANTETMEEDIKEIIGYAKSQYTGKIIFLTVGFSARLILRYTADAAIMLAPCFNIPKSLKFLSECADMTIEQALSKTDKRESIEKDMERMGMLPRFVSAEFVNPDIFSLCDYEGKKIETPVLAIYNENEQIDDSILINKRSFLTAEGGIMFRSPSEIEKIITEIIYFINEIKGRLV